MDSSLIIRTAAVGLFAVILSGGTASLASGAATTSGTSSAFRTPSTAFAASANTHTARPPLAFAALPQEGWKVGDTVEVSWAGAWYSAKILAVRAGEYRITYVGWDSSWDEWVKPSRIRSAKNPTSGVTAVDKWGTPATAADAKAGAAPGAAEPVTIWSQKPEGRYSCTTFDAGQLNRIAEITLEARGRYRETVRGGSGRYDYNAKTGRIRFLSGPQKTNAPVTFDATARNGKGWLMFDYGNGAKLHCYREALK